MARELGVVPFVPAPDFFLDGCGTTYGRNKMCPFGTYYDPRGWISKWKKVFFSKLRPESKSTWKTVPTKVLSTFFWISTLGGHFSPPSVIPVSVLRLFFIFASKSSPAGHNTAKNDTFCYVRITVLNPLRPPVNVSRPRSAPSSHRSPVARMNYPRHTYL